MLLTPANAQRITDQLAHLRGAAMKVGQMLSMDTGDLLPKELTDILARLRSDALAMPPAQLEQVLVQAYGEEWSDALYSFDYQPLAAASIGQVHRAVSQSGQQIVLKIQYPGVRESIDSDIDNVATLLKISGLLPEGIDIAPMLEVAKKQLRDEADYLKEAQYLQSYAKALVGDVRFACPQVEQQLCTRDILAMSYLEGEAIDLVAELDPEERDRVMGAMIELLFKEIFDFHLVQTDPNFANYQYNRITGQIVLLDFGACQNFDETFIDGYRALCRGWLKEDRAEIEKAAEAIGYGFGEDPGYADLMYDIFTMASEPLRFRGEYDFSQSNLASEMSDVGLAMQEHMDNWQTPPPHAMFLHRKLGGTFMLATRLGARVNVRQLLERYLE